MRPKNVPFLFFLSVCLIHVAGLTPLFAEDAQDRTTLERACREGNDGAACFNLANRIYDDAKSRGSGAQESQEIVKLLKQACDLKAKPACYFLGEAYTLISPRKVFGRFDFTPSDDARGWMDSIRRAILPNDVTGYHYFQTACDLGDPASCARSALFHLYGRAGFPKNTDKAIRILKTNCASEIAACQFLEVILQGRHPVDGAELENTRENLCRLGALYTCDLVVGAAIIKLGPQWENLLPTLDSKYVDFSRKSCEQHLPQSWGCRLLGMFAYYGHSSEPQSEVKAAEYFLEGCATGDLQACLSYGSVFELSNLDIAASKLVRDKLVSSCSSGSSLSCQVLIMNEVYGPISKPKSIEVAREALVNNKIAAEYGVYAEKTCQSRERENKQIGCKLLGDFYYYGTAGKKKSRVQAKRYLDLACQSGLATACEEAHNATGGQRQTTPPRQTNQESQSRPQAPPGWYNCPFRIGAWCYERNPYEERR